MKKKLVIFSCILLVLMISAAHAATTASSSTSTTASSSTSTGAQDAASLVYVSSVNLDPAVFYPYEVGTVSITLMNVGDQSVGLSNPDILDNKIHIVNKNTWNTISYIGSGSPITYTFLITADPPDGTYFPLFSVGTESSGSIHYPLIIKVDSTDIKASISEKPDNFSLSTKDTVNLSIINPRDGEIKKIMVTPAGTGIDVSPSVKYISSLGAGSSIEIPFAITPRQESDLTFHVSYWNGDNEHTADVVLPITLSGNKMAVEPVVNNVALKSSGSAYTITGDISNAGLTDAKSMVVTVGSPARAVEPYSDYAIGSLASDDFSSFELTFTSTDLSSVPLIITWKDRDGNSFSRTKNLDLGANAGSGTTGAITGSSGSTGSVTTTRSTGSTTARTGNSTAGGPGGQGGGSIFGFGGSRGGGISSFYPVIAGGIIIAAGIVMYKKRKWIKAKLKRK